MLANMEEIIHLWDRIPTQDVPMERKRCNTLARHFPRGCRVGSLANLKLLTA
jgi:hypothetical protein